MTLSFNLPLTLMRLTSYPSRPGYLHPLLVAVPTVGLCGALEIFGWAGRLWSAHEVLKKDPFMMQYVADRICKNAL